MDLGLSANNEGLVYETVTPSTGGMMKHSGIKGQTKRSRACSKSAEEMEIDRMIHIEVERNRRKQMNEHVQALRQLMPPSYVQKGDQASIIGGAIEFVKELKHILEYFESKKRHKISCAHNHPPTTIKTINDVNNKAKIDTHQNDDKIMVVVQHQQLPTMEEILRGKNDNGVDIISSLDYVGVILIGLDFSLIKILSKRGPKKLLKIIDVLQHALFFTILRTNITTMDQEVLYSFEVKGSINQLYPAKEIAILIQNMFGMIHASNIKG